jgi:hypothetical protein
MKAQWKAIDTENAKYVGAIELESGQYFEVVATENALVFGGACNVGFLQSGHMTLEGDETANAAMGELIDELETYYRDGAQYASRIVCNDRM